MITFISITTATGNNIRSSSSSFAIYIVIFAETYIISSLFPLKVVVLVFVVSVSSSFYFEYLFSLSAPPPYLFGMTVMRDAVAIVWWRHPSFPTSLCPFSSLSPTPSPLSVSLFVSVTFSVSPSGVRFFRYHRFVTSQSSCWSCFILLF